MRRGKAPFLSEEELIEVVAKQQGATYLRDRAILCMSHYCGLRAKELAALCINDVFTAGGTLKEVITLAGRRMTKGDTSREVFLVNERLRDAILTHIENFPIDPARHRPLFPSQKSYKHFSPNTMQRLIANLYSKASVRATSHSGRRSFATRLIEAGADIYTVKVLMGHSDISTTAGYFADSPERLKRFARML